MRHLLNGITRVLLAFGSIGSLLATPIAAQATPDSPRITIGLSGGWGLGADLWQVGDQPIRAARMTNDPPELHRFDHFNLHRRLAGGTSIGFQAAWYLSRTFGLTGEISHASLRHKDECSINLDATDPQNRLACEALNKSSSKSSSTNLLLGLMFRPMDDGGKFQLYFLAKAGIANITDQLAAVSAETTFLGEGSTLEVYPANTGSDARLMHVVGMGVTTNFHKGIQFHIEARANWLPVSVVTGPSLADGASPPTELARKRTMSLLFGVDLVLAKRIGRRY